MRKLTETEKELVKKLRAIWNDKEFVIGVLSHLKDDEERGEIIEFIDSNDDVKSEDAVLLSLDIAGRGMPRKSYAVAKGKRVK